MAVVVDSSLVLKWVLEEEYTKEARVLLGIWHKNDERLLAPPVFNSEVTNALHQGVRRGNISRSDAADALDFLLPHIAIVEPDGLYHRALSLASELGLGAAYDALYLALAEVEGCQVWTADRRLLNAVQSSFPHIRWVEESP